MHINFMHGEKIWYIRDSFFQFDRCYVWNEHYIRLFIELKAAKDQFVVEIPPEFLVAKKADFQFEHFSATSDYCYYLANESHAQIDIILDALKRLQDKGATCRLRLHPRWGDHEYVKSQAREKEIQLERTDISINESILSTRNAISLFSTVLLQCYILNIPIVVDDISSKQRFNALKELEYVALSLPHRVLSELCE
jgi:hypothetical protein